ncbi:MAG: hypothetical protein GOV15_04720, partial [Candidatus Diapherotrites archaeon]|nr:hypothetical protein [Candidatus Diapherotrites archaeon]
MKLEITEKREEPLFHRTRVLCKVESSTTPTRLEVKKNLSAKLGSDMQSLLVEKIEPNFGGKEFKVVAKLYSGPEFVSKIEKKHIIKRNDALNEAANKPAEKPKAEASEPVSEDAKPEAPAEEK